MFKLKLYVPVNNFSAMLSSEVSLGWNSTKCLAQGQNTMPPVTSPNQTQIQMARPEKKSQRTLTATFCEQTTKVVTSRERVVAKFNFKI